MKEKLFAECMEQRSAQKKHDNSEVRLAAAVRDSETTPTIIF